MADQSGNFIPITKSDRVRWLKAADAYMAKVDWADKSKVTAATNTLRPSALIPTTPRVSAQMTAISLIDVGHEESKDQLMLTEVILHVLQAIRKGLTIGLHLEELYTKSSGLDVLLEANRSSKLTTAQQPEMAAKVRTRASLAIFAAASFIVWDLAAYRTEEVSNVVMTVDAPDGIHFANTQEAIRSTFFYFGKEVQEEGKVESDAEFVKFTLLYFRHVIAAIKLREVGLTFVEPFTDRKYKLDDCDFIVDGFKEPEDRSVTSVEFNRVLFSDIVGNRVAKHNSMRTIMRMLCYDPGLEKNPMRELGGLAPIRLGHGVPGTGKSMTIAAIATELYDRAKWLGIPFLFHPLPDAIVSTYQGGSAERMMSWMNALRDPTKLVYAPIDDAENSFENRTRQGVSSGVREVIAVFLRNTEGAYAVNRGNTLIDVCTNLPEQVDPAVMSRIVERFEINGAVSEHDFIDQDHGWWKRYANMSSQFIDMSDPTNYGYFDDQKPMASISKSGKRYTEATSSDIRDIVALTLRDNDPKNQRFFGALYYNVREKFSGFSSRDVRNIQSAVTARMLDFDFPIEWMDEPTQFFLTPYDAKKGVLVELLKENMKGLSFWEIRMEEVLRYLDTMAGIANIDFERQVGRTMEAMRVQQEAANRLKSTRNANWAEGRF